MKFDARKWSMAIPVVMLPLGIWLGYRAFRGHTLADVIQSVLSIPLGHLFAAVLCAAASYICLTLFDALALRYIGHALAYRHIALTSFVSLSIGHNVGVAALSSGTLRYRFYSGFGLSAIEVGKLVVFCGVTVGLGLMTLAGISLLWRPEVLEQMLGVGTGVARALGASAVTLSIAYVALAWWLREPVQVRGMTLRMPTPGVAAAQVAIGTLNFTFVAATLHQLLAGAAAFAKMVAAYAVANITALLSHVPGGLGVLEFVIGSLVSEGDVIGALIAFRIIYFLIPLILGSTLLVAAELMRRRRRRRTRGVTPSERRHDVARSVGAGLRR